MKVESCDNPRLGKHPHTHQLRHAGVDLLHKVVSLGKLTLSLYHRDEGSYSTVQLDTYGYSVLLLAAGDSSSYVLRTRYRTTVCADIVDYYWTTYDVLAYDVLTVSIL
jgi:hypothetical protein